MTASTSEPQPLGDQQRWLVWVLSFAIWTLVAFVQTLTIYQYYRSMGRPADFLNTLGLESSQTVTYAPLTPFVLALAVRYPFRREHWLRRSILYLVGGLAFSIGHVTMRGLTPYATWDTARHVWYSAIWDSQAHVFRIQWTVFENLFFSNVADDITGTYVPIVLVAHIVSYYRRSRERERRTSLLEAQLTKANLQALKAQLQPHFLFNTLHSISALMLTDVSAADKMMTRLSDLLRMSLDNDGGQMTTLSRELEFVAGYLEIEKIRFGKRLNVVLDIADDTLDAQVPHLLLQPLVENAIRHGIARLSSSAGELRITSKREDDILHLRISDNGPGFDRIDSSRSKSGLGLKATHERLQTLYGNNQAFNLTTPPQGGVEVSVQIPFHQMRDHE